ncbi:conserved hypothetical protein [Luteimonas sp. 9C]|nr:conserved hypothetical protein [Luteimonas sp. 9C]
MQGTASRWKVLHREHAWLHANGQSGFADLVLVNASNCVMVVECKRVLESDWVFITAEGSEKTIDSRILINNTEGHGKEHRGYLDVRSSPSSYVSDFCVVAGQDSKSRPLLERLAHEVVTATEAVANEEYPHTVSRSYGFRCYVSVIVTTAQLSASAIDAADISLANGEASSQQITEVPWIRFRKQLSNEFAVAPEDLDWSFDDISRSKEKVTFVVNSNHLVTFLDKWSLFNDSLLPLMRGG